MSSTEPANGAFFVDPAEPCDARDSGVAPPGSSPLPPRRRRPRTPSDRALRGLSASMLDVPLGTLIFRAGLLAEEQLEDALQEGMRTGKRLGEVLIARGWLQERDLGRLLAAQKGLPFVDVSASDAERAALETLPEEKAKLLVALPLRFEEGRLVVAVADPSNELMLENLRRALGTVPRLVVAPYADLVRAIGAAYASPPPEAPPAPEPVVAQPEEDVEPVAAQPETAEMLEQPEPLQPEVPPQPRTDAPHMPAAEQEPVAEPIASLTSPVVRPLPIVLPPAEVRASEPAPPPLASSSPVQPPPAETAPVEPAPLAPPVETTPPLPQQVAAEPLAPEVPAPVQRDAPLVQPPPAPKPVHQPRVKPSSAADVPATPAPPVEVPASEAPAPGPGSFDAVVLRLRDGEALEAGTFPTAGEAAARAEQLIVTRSAPSRWSRRWPRRRCSANGSPRCSSWAVLLCSPRS